MNPIALLPRLRFNFRSTALLAVAPIVLFLVFAGFAAGDSASTATLGVEGLSNLTLTAFTVTPSTIHAGTTADFSVTVENRGNLEDELILNASITNSTGEEVYVFNYTNTNVTPGSIVTLTTAWNSAGFPEGNYLVNATGVYGGGANRTNSFTASFSITGNFTPTPTPTPTPPQGGSGGAVSPTPLASPLPVKPGGPTTIPPSVRPIIGVVSFSKKTVLQEVLAGEAALLTLRFQNDGDAPVAATLRFAGLPKGTPQVTPKKIFLQPATASSIDFALWISEDATPGDYVVRVSVVDDLTGADITTEYFFLRVKAYPTNYENPIVLRRVSLDTAAKTTNIVLSVRNPSVTRTLDVVDIVDSVPSPLAATENDVLFQDKIGSYLSSEPLTLAWRFLQLEPEGKRNVNYQIKTLSDDYSVYGAWTTKQVTTSRKMQLADLVTITDFRLPTLSPGSKGHASFSVFYGGLAPMQITASLALSPEFTADPRTISDVVLAPRTTQQFDFEIAANADAASGGYSARAVVAAMSDEVSSTMSLMVIPITFNLSPMILGFVAAFLALIALIAAFYWRRSARSETRFYNKDRMLYANSLRRIVFGDEKTEKP